MRLQSKFAVALLFSAPLSLCAVTPPVPLTGLSAPADDAQRNFSIREKTDIPGEILKPGIYSIRVIDHLTDRTVVTITDTSSGKATTFIAVNGASLPGGGGAGPVFWGQEERGRKALRGFRFADGSSVEFVYPKADAVAIAQANNEHVVAIDPASEGRTAAPSKLTGEDLQLVNLWQLTPVKVGPAGGIEAQRYQQVASTQTQPDLLNQGASAPAAQPALQPAVSPVRAAAAARPVVSRPKPRPVIAKLPHTAGPMPEFWLLTFLSLTGAGVLRLRRA